MRSISLANTGLFLAVATAALCGAPGMNAPALTVGRNLETTAAIRLPQVAPEDGVQLTVTSDDPARLLLSDSPEKAGASSITVKVLPRFVLSAEFWVQGLADSGSVTYTVSAAGFDSVKGTVTLVPAGVAILGPFHLPKFPTTPHGPDTKLSVVSVALDSALKVAEEQAIAGGTERSVTISNSNPAAGKPGAATLTIQGGSSRAVTYFRPHDEGETILEPVQPPGFTAPAELVKVTASVTKPGLAIVGEVYLGKDLQIPAVLCLGEAAPEGGLSVTLTSSDPSKMVISSRADRLGSQSTAITVPAGQLTATYYLQGLGDSGEVTYQAVADGFRSRTARIGLTPSGVIIAYEHYGPPDEATVLRKSEIKDSREFFASLAAAQGEPLHVVAFMTHLDPETGRAADINVQPLRPGVAATVVLTSSEPSVGTIESPLTMKPGADHVVSRFVPLRKGKTVISVNTPMGFSTPRNATTVPAIVNE